MALLGRAHAGIHLTSPLGLIDTGINYGANIAPSPEGPYRSRLVLGRFDGGIADMPGFNGVFLFGGFGHWDAPGGRLGFPIGATYNYVTKKYQFLDTQRRGPSGKKQLLHFTAAAWDTVNQRVPIHDWETDLWA